MTSELPKFDFSEPNTNSRIFGRPAEVSSRDAGWSGIYYERRMGGVFETEAHVIQNHYIMVKLNPLSRAIRVAEGRTVNETQHRGSMAYIPHDCAHKVVYPENMGELLIVTLAPTMVARIAEQLNASNGFEGKPKFANTPDPLVLAIGLDLDRELRDGNPHGPMVADIAAQMLAVHMIITYGGSQYCRSKASPSLPAKKLKWLLEHIEARLSERIGLADLALQVGLSEYHFCRAFHAATGLAPHQFILNKRIEVAQRLLKNRSLMIQDIALSIGFSDASQLSRHFRRITGVTPTEYRRGL
jgi:AraC family transcriptional regulator